MANAGCDWKYEIVTDFSITADRDNNVIVFCGFIISLETSSLLLMFWNFWVVPSSQVPEVTVTASGRTVRRRFQILDDDPGQEVSLPHTLEGERENLSCLYALKKNLMNFHPAFLSLQQWQNHHKNSCVLYSVSNGTLYPRKRLKCNDNFTHKQRCYCYIQCQILLIYLQMTLGVTRSLSYCQGMTFIHYSS